MKTQFRTQTGSVYEIDHEAKTWKRLSSTEKSGPIRTESGTFDAIQPLEVGTGALLLCPPLSEGATSRLIFTSDVVEIIYDPVEKEAECDHDVEC